MPPFFRHNIKLHGGKNAAIWAKFGGCACHRVLHIEIYEKLTQVDFLCLASIIKYPISSFVSKSTHVGIMQMKQRLDRSQNPSILIKLPIFTEEYLICIGLNWIWLHKDPQCVVDGLEENLTIIQMSLFHSNKRCLFRVQWTLTKTWDWRLNALKQKARQIQILVDIVYPPKQKSFSISFMWCIHCFCVWWENAD